MNYNGRGNQPISAEEVFRDIRKKILKLELEPGQKLSENQMCEAYGVSRSVIRVVFTRLSQLRLLDIYPQRGTYVSQIDLDHIRDLLFLRTAVEKEVLCELFREDRERERRKLIEKLEQNLLLQEQYRFSKTYENSFRKLDSEFHKLVIESVNRHRLVEMLDEHMIHIIRWRNYDMVFNQRIPRLIDEHKAVAEAIKAHNLDEALRYMENHLETIIEIDDSQYI